MVFLCLTTTIEHYFCFSKVLHQNDTYNKTLPELKVGKKIAAVTFLKSLFKKWNLSAETLDSYFAIQLSAYSPTPEKCQLSQNQTGWSSYNGLENWIPTQPYTPEKDFKWDLFGTTVTQNILVMTVLHQFTSHQHKEQTVYELHTLWWCLNQRIYSKYANSSLGVKSRKLCVEPCRASHTEIHSTQPPLWAEGRQRVSIRNRKGFLASVCLSYLMSHLPHKAYSQSRR